MVIEISNIENNYDKNSFMFRILSDFLKAEYRYQGCKLHPAVMDAAPEITAAGKTPCLYITFEEGFKIKVLLGHNNIPQLKRVDVKYKTKRSVLRDE